MALSPGNYYCCYFFFVTVHPLKGQQPLKATSSFGIHTLIFRGFISLSAIYISCTCLIMCVSGIHALASSVYNLKRFIVITRQQERPVSTLFMSNCIELDKFLFFFFF